MTRWGAHISWVRPLRYQSTRLPENAMFVKYKYLQLKSPDQSFLNHAKRAQDTLQATRTRKYSQMSSTTQHMLTTPFIIDGMRRDRRKERTSLIQHIHLSSSHSTPPSKRKPCIFIRVPHGHACVVTPISKKHAHYRIHKKLPQNACCSINTLLGELENHLKTN